MERRHPAAAAVALAGVLLAAAAAPPAAAQPIEWTAAEARSADGARIVYYEAPGAPETTPLVVISGGPGSDHRYLLVGGAFDRLAAERRVVLFDQRGTGRSSPPPEAPSVDRWVEDVEAVRRALGAPRIDLLGHSFGGYLALGYAAAHPDRVGRIVLVGSAAPRPADNRSLLAEVYPDRAERWRSVRAALPATFPAPALALFFSMEFVDPAVAELYTRAVAGLTYDVSVNDALRADMAGRDLWPAVRALERPVLVLNGRHDAVLAPATSWALHQALPDSRFHAFERSGHMPFVEEPAAFAEVVAEFLAGRPPG